MPERRREVLLCLARSGEFGAAWRAWVWFFGTGDTAVAAVVARLTGARVFDALAAETRCMWTRAALMRAAALCTVPVAPGLNLRDIERRYKLAWNMETAQKNFLQRDGLPPLSESERARARYMFHYASREHVVLGSETAMRRKHVNGETVRNSFVAFRDAEETLRFFQEWDAAEAAAKLQAKTMVFECGSYAADIPRKWVIDIDADLAKLTEEQRAEWSASHRAVVAFAVEIVAHLVRLAYLHRPCHIAITSRHVPSKKLSWHVTLCALAPFPRWREAMCRVVKLLDDAKHPLQPFVDERILRNSKSQYMQILGSTKVAMGQPCNGICFEPAGLYDGFGAPQEPLPPRHLFFAATSIMLHDPWSLPFARAVPDRQKDKANQDEGKQKKKGSPKQKKEKNDDDEPSKAKAQPNAQSPPQPWMRAFVEARDGATHYTTPPCVQNKEETTCDVAKQIGIVFYACAVQPSMCPRTFAAEGRVYQHGSDRNAIVVCTEHRMFMRCFSGKCKQLQIPPHRRSAAAWVEVFERDLASDAVRRATRASPAGLYRPKDEDCVILEPVVDAKPQSIIPRHRRALDELMRQRIGAGILRSPDDAPWEPPGAAALRIPPHAAPFALLRGGTARAVLVAKSGHCARHRQKQNDAVLLLECAERCSGALSYHLFVTCAACSAEYADPWAQVAP